VLARPRWVCLLVLMLVPLLGGCSTVTATFRTGRRLTCAAVLAALSLTGCAAGYQAETSRERTTLTAVSGAKGDLTLRNVFFVGPAAAGASLPLYFAAFNGGTTDDKLVSISSSLATGGSVPTDTALVGGGSLVFNAGASTVPQLTGLKDRSLVGQTITVTLVFQQAGELTLAVPVETSDQPGPSPEASASGTVVPSASDSASPAATASP
jgi:copper(I)-binding protein